MSEPRPTPSQSEPTTPLWLTALGGALFSVAVIGWALWPAEPPAGSVPEATADAGGQAPPAADTPPGCE